MEKSRETISVFLKHYLSKVRSPTPPAAPPEIPMKDTILEEFASSFVATGGLVSMSMPTLELTVG
jgi:hypothetical protein